MADLGREEEREGDIQNNLCKVKEVNSYHITTLRSNATTDVIAPVVSF